MDHQSYAAFATNSTNPLYLHSNESPALILVAPPLDNKNYHTWSRLMHIALISKNKERFIDGSFPKQFVSDPMYAQWIRCNTMVLSWIQRSISESIAKSVLWIATPSDVWNNLRIRFSHSDVFRISDIQEELYRFRQGTLDVSEYFTQLKMLWDELENYHPLPCCTCSFACSCGVVDSAKKYREQDYVIRFLKRLNDRFAQSKSQIMMMTPLPHIDKAFSLVIQQERELNYSLSSDSTNFEVTALHVNGQHGKQSHISKGKGNRVCTHCGRTNHTVDTCFQKNGYPPGYRQKNKGQNSTHASSQSQANNATNGSASAEIASGPSFGFIQEEFQSIWALLQQSKHLLLPIPSPLHP
ncbi:uncharacterized protein LOC131605359 [Vicia villosa]|uniref:uncharacterized protein LOC131605359 n=1 Tax=Vicia villosa TaxID=3911 RepID=UPI00273AFA2D|nr:uncharacterized protein LOC131605359 [Vicia villosa]